MLSAAAPALRRLGQALLAALGAAARLLLAPSTVIVLLVLVGLVCCVAGVFVLAGQGWALIAAGVASLITAALAARGFIGG